jgi:hypothetical protein
MRAYRARNPDYRLRERLARACRRGRKRAGFTSAVTEAGLPVGVPATVYVVAGPRGRIRLRVVTPDGAAVILEPAVGSGNSGRAVTEAGFGA